MIYLHHRLSRLQRHLRPVVICLVLLSLVALYGHDEKTSVFQPTIPGQYARPGEWPYYQWWFYGNRDQSITAFFHLLEAGQLPSEGHGAWLAWVAQDRQRKLVLLARLQQLTTATQSEVREQTAQVMATYGNIYPPVRKTVARVLVDMICRKENASIQRRLLSLAMYPSYLSPEQERTTVACVLATGDVDAWLAIELATYSQLDAPLIRQICQIWLAADTTSGMGSQNLDAWCLDEPLAIQKSGALLGTEISADSVDAIITGINADGRFNDAIVTALLERWHNGGLHTEAYIARRISRLAEAASTPVVDQWVTTLLQQPSWQLLDAFVGLSPSANVRASVITFFRKIVEEPTQSDENRRKAAFLYSQWALAADQATQRRALAFLLSLWAEPNHPAAYTTLPFTKQLADNLDAAANQQVSDLMIALIHDQRFAPAVRAGVGENLLNLYPTLDPLVIAAVIDELAAMLKGKPALQLDQGMLTVLTHLIDRLDGEQQLQLVQIILERWREVSASKDCFLYSDSASTLRYIAMAATLSSEVRRSVVIGLLQMVKDIHARGDCTNTFIPLTGLAGASRFLDQTTAQMVVTDLLTMAKSGDGPDTQELEAVAARVEAGQVLDHHAALRSLTSSFRYTKEEHERSSYAAALFLIAWCDAAYRPPIYATLLDIRNRAPLPTAVAAGETATMVEAIAPAIAAGTTPLMPGMYSITALFGVASHAAGFELYTLPFCQ